MDKADLPLLTMDPQSTNNWLLAELAFWAETLPQANTGNYESTGIRQYIALIESYVRTDHIKTRIYQSKLEEIFDFAKNNYIPHHDSPIGADIARQRFDTAALEQTLINYKISRVIVDDFLKGVYEAKYKELIDTKTQEHQEISDNISAEFGALQQYSLQENKRIADTIEAGKLSVQEHTTALEQAITANLEALSQAKEKSLSTVEAKLKAAIEASAPNEFWQKKEELHRKRANRCKWTALLLGFFAVATISLLIVAGFKDQDTTELLGYRLPSHFYVAVSIIVGSAFVWALRTTVQLMMTNFILESEALGKSTAIKTYIALSAQITDQETVRDFHKSLLNISQITIAQDSNHPEIYKAFIDFISSKKSS